MATLHEGDPAPDFDLLDDDGAHHGISAAHGHPVVVYFYPEDMTRNCTVEACEFRDANDDIRALGAEVWGISPDDEKDHAAFREKHRLNFPLLVDEDHRVADAYGTWILKITDERTYWRNARTTFLVDAGGRIVRIWENVKAEGHAAEVLAALREQSAASPRA